jgi:hypothetical protein
MLSLRSADNIMLSNVNRKQCFLIACYLFSWKLHTLFTFPQKRTILHLYHETIYLGCAHVVSFGGQSLFSSHKISLNIFTSEEI